MDGILNVSKPSGPTSHDVVQRIRGAAHTKRVGHAGTLDPIATGVLIICLGNATRIVEYLMDWRKSYRATAVFGAETDTEDATGEIIREADCSHLTREALEAVLPRFVGETLQTPPMVSAVHHEGQRLYELARAGKVVERAPRPVEIYSLSLVDFTLDAKPSATLDVECSKGTYIRTLCADIGKALDCGAYMSALTRTAVGRFKAEDALSLEAIEEGPIQNYLISIDEALANMPEVHISEEDEHRIANGVMLPVEALSRAELPQIGNPVRIKSPSGLIAIGRLCLVQGRVMLKPDKVFGAQ
ncbi:MAG TPA: tRNA pseudouridine(55) synthase TruB [Armatimonadota bacterium]|nr:tRNA pseudouridine(55) synthase TruB [Armatimonadota bacterium]